MCGVPMKPTAHGTADTDTITVPARPAALSVDSGYIMNSPKCPVCSGLGVLLGALGNLRWFRCRDCGVNFSRRRCSKVSGF